MLYQIATGWEDVEQIPQKDIIYLISSVKKIVKHKLEFFFSDGHALSKTSRIFTSPNKLYYDHL